MPCKSIHVIEYTCPKSNHVARGPSQTTIDSHSCYVCWLHNKVLKHTLFFYPSNPNLVDLLLRPGGILQIIKMQSHPKLTGTNELTLLTSKRVIDINRTFLLMIIASSFIDLFHACTHISGSRIYFHCNQWKSKLYDINEKRYTTVSLISCIADLIWIIDNFSCVVRMYT